MDSKPVLALIGAAACYGTLGVFSKLLSPYLTSFDVVFARLFIGLSLTFLLLLLFRRKIEFPKKDRLLLFLLGFSALGISATLFITSVYFTSVTNAVFLFSIHPISTILLSFRKIKSRILEYVLFAIISLSGVGLLIGFSGGASTGELIGCVLALLSSFGYAVFVVLGKKLRESNKVEQMLWAGVFVLPVLALVSIIFGNPVDFLHLSQKTWLYVFGISIIGTILPHALVLYGFKYVSAATGSIFILLEPIFAVPLAAILFAEHITLIGVVGGALIMIGAALSLRTDKKIEGTILI